MINRQKTPPWYMCVCMYMYALCKLHVGMDGVQVL